MNKLNQVTVRRIISAVVAFLLCLFTTAAALLAVVSVVTSKQYINYTVKASDYSTKAADILTVNLNDFHSISQRRRNSVEIISSCNKYNLT